MCIRDRDNSIPANPEVRNFSYTVVDDKIYYRENSRMTPVECSATVSYTHLRITLSDGEQLDRTCRYIDDYHLEVGSNPVSYTHLDLYKIQV